MTMISLGDLAQSAILRRHGTSLKADITRLSTEATTGQVTDTAARVSGDLVPITGIDASLARLKSYGAVTTEAGLFAGSMQTALGTVDDLASDLSTQLYAATSGTASARLDNVADTARQSLGTAMTALNTRVGDRALFAGTKTDTSPLCDADTLLSALETATSGATTAAGVQAAVSAWFDNPDGFAAVAYQGGAPLASFTVASGEEASLNITAADPTLKQTLKGLAMAALLDRGILSGQTEERSSLARSAGDILLQNQVDRTNLSARLGTTEAQIEDAKTRNSTETTSLQLARNAITAADPYETASKLEEAQSQLEMIYTLTARMSRLSLVNFL